MLVNTMPVDCDGYGVYIEHYKAEFDKTITIAEQLLEYQLLAIDEEQISTNENAIEVFNESIAGAFGQFIKTIFKAIIDLIANILKSVFGTGASAAASAVATASVPTNPIAAAQTNDSGNDTEKEKRVARDDKAAVNKLISRGGPQFNAKNPQKSTIRLVRIPTKQYNDFHSKDYSTLFGSCITNWADFDKKLMSEAFTAMFTITCLNRLYGRVPDLRRSASTRKDTIVVSTINAYFNLLRTTTNQWISTFGHALDNMQPLLKLAYPNADITTTTDRLIEDMKHDVEHFIKDIDIESSTSLSSSFINFSSCCGSSWSAFKSALGHKEVSFYDKKFTIDSANKDVGRDYKSMCDFRRDAAKEASDVMRTCKTVEGALKRADSEIKKLENELEGSLDKDIGKIDYWEAKLGGSQEKLDAIFRDLHNNDIPSDVWRARIQGWIKDMLSEPDMERTYMAFTKSAVSIYGSNIAFVIKTLYGEAASAAGYIMKSYSEIDKNNATEICDGLVKFCTGDDED